MIEQEPDKEDEIMSFRLREIEREMHSTLAEVKRRSEI